MRGLCRQPRVFEHAELVEDVGALVAAADAGARALRLRQARDVGPARRTVPSDGASSPDSMLTRVDLRRRWSDHRVHLAAPQLDRDVLHRGEGRRSGVRPAACTARGRMRARGVTHRQPPRPGGAGAAAGPASRSSPWASSRRARVIVRPERQLPVAGERPDPALRRIELLQQREDERAENRAAQVPRPPRIRSAAPCPTPARRASPG